MIMKSRFRKEPKPGDVLLIPLSGGDYAYILMYSFCWGWLLDFVTSYPTKEPKYFQRECFKLPLGLYGRIEKCFKTVGHVELDEMERMGPKLEHKMDPELQKFKGGTTPYEVLLPEGGGEYVTEEESKLFFPWVKIQGTRKDVDAFVQEKRSELRWIEVPPKERWTPK
jgi:hypothetical protein